MTSQLQYKWNILGHKRLLKRIEIDINESSIGHALLLLGPKKIGKFSILKKLATIMQCSCKCDDSCSLCMAISDGRHLDTFIYNSVDESIKIETIRDLQKYLHLTKQSKYKIVLIKDIERLTVPAANSLLKILEEPPSGVVFLLTSSDSSKVLDTIISRCRIYKATSENENVEKDLAELFIHSDEMAISQAVSLSNGHIGKAIEILSDPVLLDLYTKWSSELNTLTQKGLPSSLLKYSEKIAELEKPLLSEFFVVLSSFLRKKLLEADNNLAKLRYAKVLEEVHNTFALINMNVNSKLALDVLLLRCFANFSNVYSF